MVHYETLHWCTRSQIWLLSSNTVDSLFGAYSWKWQGSDQWSAEQELVLKDFVNLRAVGTRTAVRPRDKTFLADDERKVEITVDRNGTVRHSNCYFNSQIRLSHVPRLRGYPLFIVVQKETATRRIRSHVHVAAASNWRWPVIGIRRRLKSVAPRHFLTILKLKTI